MRDHSLVRAAEYEERRETIESWVEASSTDLASALFAIAAELARVVHELQILNQRT